MTCLCCPICCLRFASGTAPAAACPVCDRPMQPTSARAAVGYRLFELTDPVPLSPTAAAMAVALSALRTSRLPQS